LLHFDHIRYCPIYRKQVKAPVTGVTTYYVGDHYEVSGGVVKKYYTASG
jgi:hypothetical protein